MPSASDAGTSGEKDGMTMETPNNSTLPTGNVVPGDAAPQQTNTNPVLPDPAQTPVAAAPVESDEVRGLRQAAEAERKKRQDIESQLYQTQGLLAQVSAQTRLAQPPAPQPAEEDYLSDLSDSDLLDPGRVRQGINRAVRRVREQAVSEANQTVQQLRFQMEYPDFNTLVGARDPITGAFRPSEVLQEAFLEDPDLQRELSVASDADKARIAYRAAKYQKRLRDARAAGQRQTVQQTAQAAQFQHAANTAAAVTQPMSPSAVSGAPANSPNVDYMALARTNPAAFDAIIQDALRGRRG